MPSVPCFRNRAAGAGQRNPQIELKQLGQQKVLGPVRLIDALLGYRLAGGGPLMNLGVYCVQSGRYVLGEEPVSVTAQYGPMTLPDLFREIEENITCSSRFRLGPCVRRPRRRAATSTGSTHRPTSLFVNDSIKTINCIYMRENQLLFLLAKSPQMVHVDYDFC